MEKGETAVVLGGGEEPPVPAEFPELPRLFHTSSDGTTSVSGTTFVQLTDEMGVDNTVFQFETTADSTDARLTFSADCALTANGNSGWLDIDFLVDGLNVFPLAGGATRFCQIGDEILGTSPVSATTQAASYTVVVPDLAPGPHAVSIATSLLGGVSGAIQRPVLAISTFPNQD